VLKYHKPSPGKVDRKKLQSETIISHQAVS